MAYIRRELMSLMFAKTKDQALLALVIREAAKVAQSQGGFVGRTALQKIVYFLTVRGVPTNYKFDIYHYGPFSEKILWDIDLLLADGVIADKSSNSGKFSNYDSGPAIDEIVKMYATEMDAVSKDVKAVVSTLIPLKPNELELIATLDYLYRQQFATGVRDNIKDKVISRFQEFKKDKFPANLISSTYDAMVSARLVNN